MIYEIIWETGEHSLADYASPEEMFTAVAEQHHRATTGQAGGPTEHPAVRVVKVLAYSSNPSDVSPNVGVDVAKAEIAELMDAYADDGVFDMDTLPALVAEARSSMVKSDPHESNYKMKEAKEYSLAEIVGDK